MNYGDIMAGNNAQGPPQGRPGLRGVFGANLGLVKVLTHLQLEREGEGGGSCNRFVARQLASFTVHRFLYHCWQGAGSQGPAGVIKRFAIS